MVRDQDLNLRDWK